MAVKNTFRRVFVVAAVAAVLAVTLHSEQASAGPLIPISAAKVVDTATYKDKVGKGLRLVQTGDDTYSWVDPSDFGTMHQTGKRNHFFDITESNLREEPLQELVTEEELSSSKLKERATSIVIPSAVSKTSTVKSYISSLSSDNLKSRVTTLASYNNRYYKATTGQEAAQWVYDTLVTLKGSASYADVRKFTNSGYNQFSVIARINGTGETTNYLASELVIAGAHLDSINENSPSTGKAPGADDDGSGVTILFEVFRVLISKGYRPSRTIEFQFYAAEEAGLLGSQAIASAYQSASKSIAGMLQLDMAGYVKTASDPIMGITTDYTSSTLNTFLRKVADAYVSIRRLDYSCGYACSDHASFYKAGFNAVYPGETIDDGNPYIHTTSDTLSRLNYTYVLEYAKVVTGFVVELS